MELPGVSDSNVYVMPKGQSFPIGDVPFVLNPTTWTSTIDFVGIAPSGSAWQRTPSFNDGLNTAGLSVAALWLEPGTEYPGAGRNQVAFLELPAWILGQFSTVDDVKQALLDTDTPTAITVVGPTSSGPWQEYFVPLHYVVTDATGQSIVIEFVKGVVHVHDSPNAVLANAPTYDWQRTNVDNYANLSLIGGATSTTGNGPPLGSSMLGLPGDSLSASRFIKAWYLSQGFGQLPADGTNWLPAPGGSGANPPGFADPEQTAVVVAMQLVQICMGTPYGMLLQPGGHHEPPTIGDYTMWTSVRDHTNRNYYFVSAFSGILTKVDLDEIDFDAAPAYPDSTSLPVIPQPGAAWYVDSTSAMQTAGAAA
jgi:choloylglycine hydrolase